MSYAVEVCCYTAEDVRRAKQAGATRVELCADRSAGGTTPSYGLIEHVLCHCSYRYCRNDKTQGVGIFLQC